MSTITVSRQFGSQGNAVAREFAALLGYDYVDKELVTEVARQADVPSNEIERFDEKFENRVVGFLRRLITPGRHPITEIPEWTILDEEAPMARGCIQNQKECLKFIQSNIENLWQRGNVVIVGRGGQIILRDKCE